MSNSASKSQLQAEAQARRTFAIISHPDAGKTTLTEKLLLYSGMVRTAGMVRGRKGAKAASSDWMSMEQERGISITASAMQFPYKDVIINVLDTPGHQDFSEDTYRTLTAADSAVMVIDSTKGVEAQTRKLFTVCRLRNTPILTFMNKLDLNGREPLELIEEVEEVLGIHATPMNWPIGSGREFLGVIDIHTKDVFLYSRSAPGGAERAGVKKVSFEEFQTLEVASTSTLEKLLYDLELLSVAGNPFDREQFLSGELTPVFFGSAMNNFGVELFFDSFAELAPSPRPYRALTENSQECCVDPVDSPFSAFVFKIQANMNPRHRDSMAFLRIGLGCFERESSVFHHRTNKSVRLSRSHSMVARDRSTVDLAYPGDIVGIINPGLFQIGDTISDNANFSFPPLPQFPPEVLAQIRALDVSKRKAFDKGIQQLSEEGAIQVLTSFQNPNAEPYVAAVGKLQFEVLQHRLQEEYGVKTELSVLPHQFGVWLEGDPKTFRAPSSALLARDKRDQIIVFFTSEWQKQYAAEQNPQHSFIAFPQ